MTKVIDNPVATQVTTSNEKRSLDVIAADIHRIERNNIFDIGKLLVEADKACSHGEWMEWLEHNFAWWSHDTALRYMAAYRLATKYARVRNLGVPSSIIYDLATDLDDPDLPSIIEALAKATKGKTKVITVAAANEVVDLTKLQIKFGDYPAATLSALDKNVPDDDDSAWAAGASEQLKKARPTTEEAAQKIVLAYHRKHLEKLFGGALPEWLDEMTLDLLDDVEDPHRKTLLQKLQAMPQPLDDGQIFNIIFIINAIRRSGGDKDQDSEEDQCGDEDQDEQDDERDDEVPSPPDLDAELLEALRVILHHARRPMPTSVGGIKGAELVEAARFLDKLHELATGGSRVKRIADRAEARSRNGRGAAETTASTDRWSES
jgi:hypothetical protein